MDAKSPTPAKLHDTVLDTSVVQVAHVYAAALFAAASTANQLDLVVDEYQSLIDDVLAKNPQFDRVLKSTIIGRADLASTIRRVFEGRSSGVVLNFLLVLNDHGRLNLLRPVLTELLALRDQKLGRIPVQVQSAVPLDPADERALHDRLAVITGGQPVIHTEIVSSLLGGMVIRVGDTVFDGSVRTRLRRLREQLIQRSTHEIQSRRDQFSHPA